MKYREKKEQKQRVPVSHWRLGGYYKCNGRGREDKDRRKTIFKHNGQDFCNLDKNYKTWIKKKAKNKQKSLNNPQALKQE